MRVEDSPPKVSLWVEDKIEKTASFARKFSITSRYIDIEQSWMSYQSLGTFGCYNPMRF
jgi:hypothetical protein